MNKITDKTWIMFLIGGDRHFLTEIEANKIKVALRIGDKYIDLGSVFFATNQFAKLLNGADYQETEKFKRGDYKCLCGQWIPRGKTCGKCF